LHYGSRSGEETTNVMNTLEKILATLQKENIQTFEQQYRKHLFVMFWIDAAICLGAFSIIIGIIVLAHFVL
jgi:CHASE3 domain sensor protein